MEKKQIKLFSNLIIYIIVMCCCGNVMASLDSLALVEKYQELEKAKTSDKLPIYEELSWELRRTNNERAQQLAERGMAVALSLKDSLHYHHIKANLAIILVLQNDYEAGFEKLGAAIDYYQRNQHDSAAAKRLGQLGAVYSFYGNHSMADSVLSKAIFLLQQLGDKKELLNTQLSKGINNYQSNNYVAAKRDYLTGLHLSNELGDNLTTAKLYTNLGLVEAALNNHPMALLNYQKASKIAHNDLLLKSNVHNNYGILYFDLREWDKAIEQYEKALIIGRQRNADREILFALNNIGLAHQRKLNYGMSLDYFEEALRISQKNTSLNSGVIEIYNNIGLSQMELREYKLAAKYFDTTYQKAIVISDTLMMARAQKNKAENLFRQREFRKAIEYSLLGYQLSKLIKHDKTTEQTAALLSKSYAEIGDFELAFIYQKRQQQILDTLLTNEHLQKIADLEIQYEIEKKEKEIQLQKAKLATLAQHQSVSATKIWILLLICAFMLLAILTILLYYRMEKKLLKSNIRATEKKVSSIEKERNQLEETVIEQKEQLNQYLKNLLEKSELLINLKKDISALSFQQKDAGTIESINTLLNKNIQSEQDWKKFEFYFSKVHQNFFKKLNAIYPKLTTYDLNLSALIKLNLKNKEIAQILGISPASVKKSRQRLYQKMDLADNDALRNYLIQL